MNRMSSEDLVYDLILRHFPGDPSFWINPSGNKGDKMYKKPVFKRNSRDFRSKRRRLVLRAAVSFLIFSTLTATLIRLSHKNNLTPVNLPAGTAGQFARQLENSGQYQLAGRLIDRMPPIYALGNSGQIKEILVNARKRSGPNHIYKFKTDTGKGTIVLPPETLSNGSAVNDTGLTMQYPDIFYISSFNGQPQSVNAYNLNNNKRTVFAFSGLVEKANLIPLNNNQVKVQLVENKQNTAAFLTIRKDSISSDSPNLQLMSNNSDNTSAFIRLVEGVKRIAGNGTVAFFENIWYQTKDTLTNLLFSVNGGNQRHDLTLKPSVKPQ